MVWAYVVTIKRGGSMRVKTFYTKPILFKWIDNKMSENWTEVTILKEKGNENDLPTL